MASLTEVMRRYVADLVDYGFDNLRFPVAATLRWWLSQTMLGEDPGPAARAFREWRDREAEPGKPWERLVEAAACVAGNLMLGESAAAWANRGLEHLGSVQKAPGFAAPNDVLELGLGLETAAGNQERALRYREALLKEAIDPTIGVPGFERLYLSSPLPSDAPLEAPAWSAFRANIDTMRRSAPELVSPTLCLLARFSDPVRGAAPLLEGRIPEYDRRTALGDDRYGQRLSYEPVRLGLVENANEPLIEMVIEVKGEGRFDGAFERCPPLTTDLIGTIDTLIKSAGRKDKKAITAALKVGGARLSAELRLPHNVDADPPDFDAITRRFAVAVEHARHHRGWQVNTSVVRSA